MSNSIAPGSSADVNVRVTALTTNPNVPAQYKTIILKKNLVNGVNTLTQEMISTSNTKYVIKYNYTLGENITVPADCILEFDGGSINGDGTLTVSKNLVINGNGAVFNVSSAPFIISQVRFSILKIKDLTINYIGEKTTNFLINLVRGSQTNNLYDSGCENVIFNLNNNCNGIDIQWTHYFTINKCRFMEHNTCGINYLHGWMNYINNSYFHKEVFANQPTDSYSVLMNTSSAVAITETCFDGKDTGIRMQQSCAGIEISNCTFEENLRGIWLGPYTGVMGISIIGNYFEADDINTILVEGLPDRCKGISIIGNEFASSGSGRDGFESNGRCTIQGGTGFTIMSNRFGAPLSVGTNAKKVFIAGNWYGNGATYTEQGFKLLDGDNPDVIDLDANRRGDTASRPTVNVKKGFLYNDIELGKLVRRSDPSTVWKDNYNHTITDIVWLDENGSALHGITALRGTQATRSNMSPQRLNAGVKFFDTDLGRFLTWNGEGWVNDEGINMLNVVATKGGSTVRESMSDPDSPTKLIMANQGLVFYDTSIRKHVYWNGLNWLEEDGAAAGVNRSGTFANKPSASDIYVGFEYFCTDKQTTEGATNGIMIYHKGNNVWVDALGRVVS